MTSAIGEMKVKQTVYCSICGCSHTRNFKACVYENTPAAIAVAKAELARKAEKIYTCRICASIQKTVE